MDLGTLGVQIKWILEHWGTDQINLRTLGDGSWNIGGTDKMDLRTLGTDKIS